MLNLFLIKKENVMRKNEVMLSEVDMVLTILNLQLIRLPPQ